MFTPRLHASFSPFLSTCTAHPVSVILTFASILSFPHCSLLYRLISAAFPSLSLSNCHEMRAAAVHLVSDEAVAAVTMFST